MTDQRADDAVEPSGDEITIDPELTTAAHAGWLADLRSQARSTGVSVGDLLRAADDEAVDDEDHNADTPHVDADPVQEHHADAATIAPDDDTMDAVRAAVAAARPTPAVAQPTPATPRPAPPLPPPTPIEPQPSVAVPRSDAGVRWEPPARLSTGREAPIPTLVATETRRSIMPLVAALGVVIVALIVVVVVLVWPGGNDAPVDPTDSVVEIEVDPDAPVGEETE